MANVKDLIAKKGPLVAAIGKADTVVTAAERMNDKRIGALVVTEGDMVVGIFTERDVLTRIVAAHRDPKTTTVGEVMSTPVACCHPNTTIDECRSVMTNRRIRHLPVVDEGRLVGIITSGDILAQKVLAQQETIEVLQEYLYNQPR
jgi:CBS domain-containing protein